MTKTYDGWSISTGSPIVSLFTGFGDAHGAYDVDASAVKYAEMCRKALEKEFPGAKISVPYEVNAQGVVSLPLQTVVTDPDGGDYQPGDYGEGGRIADQVEDVCERVWQSWGWIVYE